MPMNLLLLVATFANPVGPPGVPCCPRPQLQTPCPPFLLCPGLPVLLVDVVEPFITTLSGPCP